MQVTDLKAILDYEHNEQWLAALEKAASKASISVWIRK